MPDPLWRVETRQIRGKKRVLHIPHPELRELQKRIDQIAKDLYRPLPGITITGGVKDHSPVTNALIHFDQRDGENELYFLKIDLKDAYASIRPSGVAEDILETVRKRGVEWSAREMTRYLMAPSGGLAFGAASSPALFNLYLHPLDEALSYLALAERLTITRYYDDIWFSSPLPITRSLRREITDLITKARRAFSINPKKAGMYTHPDQDVVITGVMLRRDGSIGLPRSVLKQMQGFLHLAMRDNLPSSMVGGRMGFFRQVWRSARFRDIPPTNLELQVLRAYWRYQTAQRRKKREVKPVALPMHNARGQFEFTF